MDYLIYLVATNDTYGNPRRAWVQLKDGVAIASFDEHYAGASALPEEIRKKFHLAPRINVTPTELKRWKQMAREYGTTLEFSDGTKYRRNAD